MEHDLWRHIRAALRRVPRRRPRNAVYDNQQILAVYLWAALHQRPVDWATKRENWPMQAWRRALPDQSTMSRRLRDPRFQEDLRCLLQHMQRHFKKGRLLIVDGKAFELHDRTRDRDAKVGWASGGYAKGYKLHVIIDDQQRVVNWSVTPMNKAESIVAAEIIQDAPEADLARLMVGDRSYDSNSLHATTAARGVQLLAGRRKPNRTLGHRPHHAHRLRAIEFIERRGGWMWPYLANRRQEIERFFSSLVCSGVGISHLPPWVRWQHRVSNWIGAKLVINAARIVRLRTLHA